VIDFRDLIKAGLHFGHQKARWNPRMEPFIWGYRSGVYLIDVSKTAEALERAAKFIEEVAARGDQILWVGTKKSAQKVVEHNARELEMPYVSHRWIGGTLTNYSQVKKSVTKLLHFEDVLSRADEYAYKKKELLTISKHVDRLINNVGGIRMLKWPVGALIVIDVRHEQTALREARAAGVPVIALVDTNSDPSLVDYVIPGNDDSPKAIEVVVTYLAAAAKRGMAAIEKAKEHAKAERNAVKKSKESPVKADEKTSAVDEREVIQEGGDVRQKGIESAVHVSAEDVAVELIEELSEDIDDEDDDAPVKVAKQAIKAKRSVAKKPQDDDETEGARVKPALKKPTTTAIRGKKAVGTKSAATVEKGVTRKAVVVKKVGAKK
jgi:small subunit ribosomal protein S2